MHGEYFSQYPVYGLVGLDVVFVGVYVPWYWKYFAEQRCDLVAFCGVVQTLYVAWKPFDGSCLGSALSTELGLGGDWAMVVMYV